MEILWNTSRNHLRSIKKLDTEKKKVPVTETLELEPHQSISQKEIKYRDGKVASYAHPGTVYDEDGEYERGWA